MNINYGHNKELMKKCRKLEEYSVFVGKVREKLAQGVDRNTAVHMAVEESIQLGVLKDILIKNRNEVVDMILTTFDQELHDKTEREAAYAEGKLEGKLEGQSEGEVTVLAGIIRRKRAKEMSPDAIAEDLGFDADYVKKIVALMEEDGSRGDLQIAKLLLKRSEPNQ